MPSKKEQAELNQMEKVEAKPLPKTDITKRDVKLLPASNDIEKVVLGAMLLEQDALLKYVSKLHEDFFDNPDNALVFKTIKKIYKNSGHVDLLTVMEQLKKDGNTKKIKDCAYYISQLTANIASAAHTASHILILKEKYIARKSIEIGYEIVRENERDATDPLDNLERAQRELSKLSSILTSKDLIHLSSMIKDSLKEIEARKGRGEEFTGIPSGFSGIDKITLGWQNSDLIIIGGRPSMGKSSFVVSAAINATMMFNKKIAFYSLETSSAQLAYRIISSTTGIPLKDLKRGNIKDEQMKKMITDSGELSNAHFYLDDSAGIDIFQLQSKIRQAVNEFKIELVIIDYLQLLSKREDMQEVTEIAKGLKGVAKELNIPVIAVSQLSRETEKRAKENKMPQLADLRSSGAIEQVADVIMFLYRPEYYGIVTDENGNNLRGLADVIIAKHRDGATGEVRLVFTQSTTTFKDYITDEPGQPSEPEPPGEAAPF